MRLLLRKYTVQAHLYVYWRFRTREGEERIVNRMVPVFQVFDESLGLYGQVNKRTWWMPWQLEAMKDVVGHESPRGAVKQALIRGCPNGETHPSP